MANNKNDDPIPLPPDAQLDRPSVARIYDYLLGGYHNFEIDRKAAEHFGAIFPDLALTAQLNRAFLRRAATFVSKQGIDQFLDLGSGIPTVGNVHEIVQEYQPHARTVYVDIEPVAIAHAETLLADDRNTAAILGDIRRPHEILEHPITKQLIDFSRPVGLLVVAMLHYVTDDEEAERVLNVFKDQLVSGSYLVVGVWTSDDAPHEVMNKYAEMSKMLTTQGAPRPLAKVERYFDGFELLEPGIVHGPAWRPDDPDDWILKEPGRSVSWVGVARKP